MSIFSQVITPTKWAIDQLLSDTNFSEEVTLKTFSGQTWSDTEGRMVDSYASHTMRAARMRHNKESVKVASSDVELGDMLFLFRGEDFPDDTTLKATVVDAGGNELGIKGIDPIFDLAVSVTVVGAK